MAQSNVRSVGLTICPYCRQPIGQKEQQQILDKEEERSALQRAALVEEVGDAHRREGEEAEEKRRLLTVQLEEARDQAGRVPEMVAEQVEAERERVKAEALRESNHQLETMRRSLELKEQQLARSENSAENLRRQLEESHAPHETGGISESELEQQLTRMFPRDRIERISKGQSGADVKQMVMDGAVECGIILYECKDTRNWQSTFVARLAIDKAECKAAYAILVSTAAPAKSDGFALVDGIPVMHPKFVEHIVPIVREALVKAKTAELSGENAGEKFEELLLYLNSPDFANRMKGAAKAIQDLESLQLQEKRAHERVWGKQATLHAQAGKHVYEVQTEISRILVRK